MKKVKLRDLRSYSNRTRFYLIVGGILLTFIVGDGLIYLIYGSYAAILGFTCISGGVGLILLITLIFWVMDLIVKNANKE